MQVELVQEELKHLDFRRGKIKEKIKELESLMTGVRCSILPYVTEESGAYSEEKLERFIGGLIDCLEQYKEHTLNENEKKLYESFLYCTIRGVTADLWHYHTGAPYWIAPCRTYEDIISMAEDPETLRIQNPEELHFEEIYNPLELGGFFAYMNHVYMLLTGEHIEQDITDEERETVRNLYPEAVAIEKSWEEREAIEKCLTQEELDMAAQEEEAWSELYAEEELYEQEEYEETEKYRTEWVQGFGDIRPFCEHYKRYRELYFKADKSSFAADIRDMIDVFLMEQGISCFGDEDKFILAYTLADQSYRHIKKKLSEGE